MSDGFTCDASLMVENETLKKEVNELTCALDKAYGGEDHLLICFGSQRASLYKEELGYTLKKGKAAFAPHKTEQWSVLHYLQASWSQRAWLQEREITC